MFRRVSIKLSAASLLLAFLILLVPQVTHACSLTDPASWPECIIQGITYIIGSIIKVILILGGWFLEIALAMNRDILKSPAVTTGFKIALSVANLGFIIGIVIIAIATILRIESYGVKKILWKLVVAALLVNFSFVIISPLLATADSLTNYFMSGLSDGSISNFGTNFAASFKPQTYSGATAGESGAAARAAAGTVEIITSTVISILMLVVITITIFALFIMLMVRYVVLSVLIILMPFVWVAWVFPYLQSNWSKWWQSFLRWTFFAPIVIFFIYLGIAITLDKTYVGDKATELENSGKSAATAVQSLGAVQGFFKNLTGDIAQQIVVLGIMIGGLFAANKLSIAGAGAFYGAATKASGAIFGGAGRIAGRRATQAGTGLLRGKIGQKTVSALQAPSKPGFLGRTTGFLKTVTGARYLGRGLETLGVAGGAKMIDDAEKRIRGKTDDQLANNMTTFSADERIAALKILQSHGTLDKLKDKGGVDRYMDENLFNRYQQGKSFGDLNKAVMSNSAMREAAKVIGKEGEGATMVDKNAVLGKANETVKAMDLMKKASMDFVQTLSKSDVAKAQSNDVFSEKDGLGIGEAAAEVLKKNIALGFAEARPELVPGMLPKLKGKQLQHFIGLYRNALTNITDIDERQKRSEAFEKSVLNNTMGFIPETPTGEAPPASPPPPPPPKA